MQGITEGDQELARVIVSKSQKLTTATQRLAAEIAKADLAVALIAIDKAKQFAKKRPATVRGALFFAPVAALALAGIIVGATSGGPAVTMSAATSRPATVTPGRLPHRLLFNLDAPRTYAPPPVVARQVPPTPVRHHHRHRLATSPPPQQQQGPYIPPTRHYFCDTTTPSDCPSWTYAVASYVNGWGGEAQAQADFPHAYQIPIDARGDDPQQASALDVEPGAAPISAIRQWAITRNQMGYWAVIYCNRSVVPEVLQQLAGLHYHLWLPNITGSSGDSAVPGADAVQFAWWPSVTNPQWDEDWTWMTMSQMFGRY